MIPHGPAPIFGKFPVFPRKISSAAATLHKVMTPPNSGRPAETGDGSAGMNPHALLARHSRWLRTVVLARTGSADAVDEVLQEVAVAFANGDSFPTDANAVAPWLYRVAVRQSLLYRRRLGRERRLNFNFARVVRPGESDEKAIDPLGWLLAEERRKLVRLALKKLAPKDSEMLLLKYTEHWSYRELASHLGVSVSAVESRLHRARARLRHELVQMQVVEVVT